MKKIVLSLFFLLGAFFTLSAFNVFADTPVYSVDVTIQLADDTTDTLSLTDLPFGQEISFDVTAWDDESYDFLGFIIEGKVVQSIESAQSFRVTENMNVVAYFKPAGSLAVIFMDSNHDFIDVEYTGVDGKLTSVPSYAAYTKPGLTSTGWNVDDIANHVFTEDTLVYLEYENASGQKTLTYDDGTGVQIETRDYNGLVTLEAVGENFSYWLKDNIIVSLESTYTFTMLDNHTVEAVFNDNEFVPDSQTLVTVSDMLNLRTGFDSIVGQFHLGPNEELVEWGIIASDLPGGITHDTPDVGVFNSRRYNETSQEFLMSFDNAIFSFSNYRGFVTTINTVTDVITTTYSYCQDVISIPEYASDLIISEYGEGSSSNKWIEIYNGTGSAVDLSEYTVELYSNGASSASSTQSLTGTLANDDVYVIYNSSAVSEISSNGDISSSVANFNGDDAVALLKNDVAIDVIGQIGFDPGSNWSGNSVSTSDQTLVRKSDITSGDSNGSDAFDPSLEWDTYAQDSFEYIGSHSMNLPTNDVYVTYTSSNTPSSLTVTGDTSVNQNETIQLTSDVQNVIWVSSNPSVLTVDQNGLVTGVSEGVANITAYAFLDHSVNDTIAITGLGLTTYDVTFDFNNLEADDIVAVEGGSPVSEPTEPVYTNHLFDGWYTSSDNGVTLDTEWDFLTAITEDITLYAKWIDLSQALTVTEIWDASGLTNVEVIGVVAAITDTGYILQDVATAEMISVHDSVNVVSIGDEIYIEAEYSEVSEIALLGNITYFRVYNTGVALNLDVSQAMSIDFDNYNQADYIGKLVKVEQPFADDTGTYTRIANDLNGLATQLYDGKYVGIHNSSAGSAITVLDNADNEQFLTYTVYIFFYDSTSDYQKAIVIDANHIVLETTYDVTFEVDGGSAVDAQTIIDGNLATQPTDPTKTGFEFAGWFSDAGLTTSFNFSTPITQTTVVYAKWNSVQTWTVTYDSDEGSAVASEVVNDGELATQPSDPTKDGFTFGGWYTDAGLTTPFDFDNDVIVADITLYAKWDEIAIDSVTVTASYTGTTTTNMTDGNNASLINLDPLIFNVISTKRVNSPLHIGLNSAGQIRLYGSSDTNGNILTITIDSNYVITDISITTGTTGNALITADSSVLFDGNLPSGTVTYNNLSASSFDIKNTNSSTSQIYILSIEITYIPNPE
jgi:uncharacterized repeat protein (TIGR02543 family)